MYISHLQDRCSGATMLQPGLQRMELKEVREIYKGLKVGTERKLNARKSSSALTNESADTNPNAAPCEQELRDKIDLLNVQPSQIEDANSRPAQGDRESVRLR